MTMVTQLTLHQDFAGQAAKQRELAQHQPRPSRVRFTVRTTGGGESRLQGKGALSFGAHMLDEPSFSFGVQAIGPLTAGQLPQATAVVLRYLTNSGGLYTGAEVGFTVSCAKADVGLKFSLTFEGTTLRSTVGSDASTATAPHGVNYYQGTPTQGGE